MKEVELIISIISTLFFIIFLIISFLLKFIKNEKTKKVLEGILEVTNELIPLMSEVESFRMLKGNEKKEYVKKELQKYLENRNLIVEEDLIDKKIEQLIMFSKNVNFNQKESE